MNLSSPLTALKGVGEKREKLYQKLGINNIGELLEHYPRGYLDLTGSLTIQEASDEHPCAVKAVITQKSATRPIRRGLTVTKVRATDMEKDLLITFWNAKYTVDALEIGKEYIFYGDFTRHFTGGEMNSPAVISTDERGFLPQYPLTEGLSSKMVSAQMKEAICSCGNLIKETLSDAVLRKYGLCSKAEAVCGIHFPSDEKALEKAKKRLIFEEFLAFTLGMSLTKGKERLANGNAFSPDLSTDEFTDSLGFELTGAQKRVIAECKKDMCSNVPMSRLIQGDVGSGKTAVAASCMYFAAKNGFQSAMMAPTEVLASQHKATLEKMFAPFGIKVGLLTGSMKASEKNAVKEAIKNGEITIVTGTHALIQEDVEFKSLGLIITDEQHRFGVRQRMALGKKGCAPHTIVMSATPIPRTLAFVLYGDLDISILDEMPKKRIPVKTYLVEPELSQRALNFVRNFAKEGKQSYIVCPLIERNEDSLPLEAAADLAEQIAGQELCDCNVGLLHGKMKPAEKERVMQAFAENRLQVLVSTTVIEVGVDVPNAVCMVIENAERFGLSQLHQLRGRVGRGTEQSYCILISGKKNPETKRRLEVIAKTTDGFKVAEEDLKLRGPGDFFGYRQSGLPMLKMADMMTDISLLELAKKAAAEILSEDPRLEKPENAALSANIRKLLEEAAI